MGLALGGGGFPSATLSISLLLVALIPFGALSFYNFPCADDYTYAVATLQKGLWPAQADWYRDWSGRYLATFLLSVSPVTARSLAGYHLVAFATVLGFAGLCRCVIRTFGGSLVSSRQATLAGLVLLALYLSEAPSLVEGFYWLPGVFIHTWALCLLLVAVVWYCRLRRWRFGETPRAHASALAEISFAVGLAALTVAVAGLNETVILVEVYLIGLAVVVHYLWFRRIDWVFVVPVIAAAICFWIALQAPGNDVRSAQFIHGNQLSRTVSKTLDLGFEMVFRYLQPPFLLALFLAIPEILERRPGIASRFYDRRARWFFVLSLLGCIVVFLTPAHWAMGVKPPKRAMNVICFLYMVWASLIFVQFVCAHPERMRELFSVVTQRAPAPALAMIFGAVLMLSGNLRVVWSDLLFEAATYHEEALRREELLEHSKELDVVVRPYSVQPDSLVFDDVTEDADDWRNVSVAQYYGVKSVRLAAMPSPGSSGP